MKKILVTPRSFGKYNREELSELFLRHDIEAVYNPYGAILTEEQLEQELPDRDGVIIGVDPLPESVLKTAGKLKAIAKYGVGTDNIDLHYAEQRGIKVSRTVGANSDAVADYSFALLMAVARRVVEIDNGCHADDWGKRIALDIHGKTIGILGLGAIGKGVALRAKGFGMEVLAYDVFRDEEFARQQGITFTDVETIVKKADFISIHLPLTPETHHLINRDTLQNAKKNLIIVNTSRGGMVNEDDLYELISEGRIYGAGIDVFEHEPPRDSRLLTLKSVVVGSHTAASTVAATQKMSRMAAENLIRDMGE